MTFSSGLASEMNAFVADSRVGAGWRIQTKRSDHVVTKNTVKEHSMGAVTTKRVLFPFYLRHQAFHDRASETTDAVASNDATAYYNRAVVEQKNGDLDKALADFNRAIE